MIGDQLHIVICVKQTSSASNVAAGAAPGASRAAMNPFDEYALEEGVRIKERANGKAVVSVLSLGPQDAVGTLRETIARGADAVYLLSSPDFDGSDAYATSYALSKAVEKLSKEKGPVDLVLFGKQTNDSDTGQVGPGVAAWLNWPNVAFVKKLEIGSGKAIASRLMEDGTDVLDLALPACVSVVKEINEPRLPSLKGKMAAKKAEIPVWGPAELAADTSKAGAQGSRLAVSAPSAPPMRSGGVKVEGATAQEKAKNLLAKLREMKLV